MPLQYRSTVPKVPIWALPPMATLPSFTMKGPPSKRALPLELGQSPIMYQDPVKLPFPLMWPLPPGFTGPSA